MDLSSRLHGTSMRTISTPARISSIMSVARASTCLALAATAAPVIRTLWVRKIELMVLWWRRGGIVAGTGEGGGTLGLSLDVPHARLLGPGVSFVGFCVDMCDNRGGGSGVWSAAVAVGGRGLGIGTIGDDVGLVCCAADVAVSLENFFGGDIGGVCEKLVIFQNGLEIVWYLKKRGLELECFEDGREQYSPRTSHRCSRGAN